MTIVADQSGFPNPDEIDGFWAFDKMHAPRPISPLASDIIIATLSEGFSAAHGEFDAPIDVSHKLVNYYYYASFHPMQDQVAAADRNTRYLKTLDAKVPGVGKQWVTEWQPAIESAHVTEKATNYAGFSDDELLAKLDELHDRMRSHWQVHGRINFVLISAAKYCDFYDALVKPSDPTESYQSIQGFDTQSVAASRGLWQLSRRARDNAEIRKLFATTAPRDLPQVLAASADGKAFLAELHDYLERFGWRSDAVYDIGDVTWREDPSIPLGAISGYIDLDERASPEVLHRRSKDTRESLLAKARALLANDPDKLAEFENLYDAARYSNQVTEDHAFWIDQMGVAVIRRFVQHLGTVLAGRGLIAEPADVFMLYKPELVDTVRNNIDRRQLVAQRRAEIDAWAAVSPPPTLGTPPAPEPDPFMDAVTVRLLGITPPDDSPQDPNVLKGVAGAPGVVRGKVRVVRSLNEASVLQDGDIMVCEMTLPPWVPLFSIVGGVVADTGGVLSHCAIVAREFELPAVVGTLFGTSALQDGMVVEVDGTRGIVTILERP